MGSFVLGVLVLGSFDLSLEGFFGGEFALVVSSEDELGEGYVGAGVLFLACQVD